VALALAEAAADPQEPVQSSTVRLVDLASHEASGLIEAAEPELGVDGRGWQVGLRGRVRILRPTIEPIPRCLASVCPDQTGWVVVEAARPASEPGTLPGVFADAAVVLACRA
jgi:hypothetical protein